MAALDPVTSSSPTQLCDTEHAHSCELHTLFTGDVQSVACTLHNSLTQMSLLDLNGSKFPRQMLFDRGFFFFSPPHAENGSAQLKGISQLLFQPT